LWTKLTSISGETTSTAIAAVLFGLLKTPDALSRATREVRDAFGNEDDITVATTSKLEYLDACISEGMRLGPPSVIGVPRVVPRGGQEICGEWVPPQTSVAINQYPAFRSTSNFSQPEVFMPERFLDAKGMGDNLAVFQPFLVGRHQCIG
jgi:cytochrome P450